MNRKLLQPSLRKDLIYMSLSCGFKRNCLFMHWDLRNTSPDGLFVHWDSRNTSPDGLFKYWDLRNTSPNGLLTVCRRRATTKKKPWRSRLQSMIMEFGFCGVNKRILELRYCGLDETDLGIWEKWLSQREWRKSAYLPIISFPKLISILRTLNQSDWRYVVELEHIWRKARSPPFIL